MSAFIGTRSPMQCRTHHQKYLNKYEKVEEIIRMYNTSLREAEGNKRSEVNIQED